MDGSSITPVHIRWQDLSLPDTENDRPWDESQISAWAEETFPDEDGVGEQHDQSEGTPVAVNDEDEEPAVGSVDEPKDENLVRNRTWSQTLKLFSFYLLVILAAIGAFQWATAIGAFEWPTWTEINSDCLYPQSNSQSSLNFALPFFINRTAHEAVLNELGDSEALAQLVFAQSEVHSSLMATSQKLTGHFACVIKIKPIEIAGLDVFHTMSTQLTVTKLAVSDVTEIYRFLKPAYHRLNITAAKAVEAVRPDGIRKFVMKAQPVFFIDTIKWYWDPWIEKQEKLTEAQSGVIALETELQRLEEIAQAILEVKRDLARLHAELFQWAKRSLERSQEPSSGLMQWVAQARQSLRLERGELRQERRKELFRQHIAQHMVQDGEAITDKQFDSWWVNLDCGCRT